MSNTTLNKKISIIIRCFNEEQHIGKLLCGILEQTVQDNEIIVVDSGSTDSTVSIAARFPVKIVELNPEDFSFGHALNLGCGVANGDFLVFASAHVYPVYREWLEKLVAPLNDSSVAVVYGRQVGGGTTKYSEKQVFEKWYGKSANPDQKHPFCNNANAAIRSELWREFPYDENLTGLEDLAWARNIQERGYKIVYEPGAVVVHVHNETPRLIYNRYRREAMAMKNIYPEQKFTFFDMVLLCFSNIFTDLIHAARDGVLFRNLLDIIGFRTCQFLGTYHGYNRQTGVTRELKRKFYYPNELKRSGDTVPEKYTNPTTEIDYARKHH